MQADETNLHSKVGTPGIKRLVTTLSQVQIPESGNPHEDSHCQEVYYIWTVIRNNYWDLKLTYHSDALVALSGITNFMYVYHEVTPSSDSIADHALSTGSG